MSSESNGNLGFMVFIPCHRFVEGQTMLSIESAHMAGLPFMAVPVPGDALIGRARSLICTQWLEKQSTPYMVFLDSDIVFEPRDLARLYDNLRAGYDLIGGLYPVKTSKQMAHYGLNNQLRADGTIQEVRFLSTGFTGISRRLLQRMVEQLKLPLLNKDDWSRCYPFFESGRALDVQGVTCYNNIYLSEDWDFAEKARQVGIKPYVDSSILLGHMGTRVWTVQDYFQQQAVQAALQKQAEQQTAAPKEAVAKEKDFVATS